MEKRFKKIEEELIKQVVEVIATSHTQLTYVQQQQLFELLSKLDDVVDEEPKKKD